MKEIVHARVSFSRNATFFLLESVPYLALAVLTGFLADLFVPWGWPMIVGAFSAVFALHLGLSVRFAMYLLAQEKKRLAGVLVLPRESGGSVPYLFAICGAALGWELYDAVGHASFPLLTAIFLLADYSKEGWFASLSQK